MQPEASTPLDDAFSTPVSQEPSLGERVAALAGCDIADDSVAQTPAAGAATGPITADSLSVLLTQALRAQDKVRFDFYFFGFFQTVRAVLCV